MGLNAIRLGKQKELQLGNLDAKRDWGHAKDYCMAMYLMLQQDTPDDYVIATGEQFSVRQFVEKCAPYFDMKIKWIGDGIDEIGIDENTGNTVISIDPIYFRPAEVESLLGDSTKARTELNWKPEYDFDSLVEEMCIHERSKV